MTDPKYTHRPAMGQPIIRGLDASDRAPLSEFLSVPPPPDGWAQIEAAIAALHREDSRRRDVLAATGIVAAIVHAVAGDDPIEIDVDAIDVDGTGRARWDLSVVQLTGGRLQLRAVPNREDAK